MQAYLQWFGVCLRGSFIVLLLHAVCCDHKRFPAAAAAAAAAAAQDLGQACHTGNCALSCGLFYRAVRLPWVATTKGCKKHAQLMGSGQWGSSLTPSNQ